jgi:hypothetical protein
VDRLRRARRLLAPPLVCPRTRKGNRPGVQSPRQDGPERRGEAAGAKEPNDAKERSVIIPLDADDALRALARFSYSGEPDEDAADAAGEADGRARAREADDAAG